MDRRSWTVLLPLLAGCAGSPDPVVPVAPKATVQAEAPRAPAPPVERASGGFSYSYAFGSFRDPFRREGPCCGPPPVDACLEPLCFYDLEQLKLTGVISGTARPVAVVETPDGKGHSVYAGTRMGKHQGRVKSIGRDSVVVEEAFSEGEKVQTVPTVLRMKSDAPVPLGE